MSSILCSWLWPFKCACLLHVMLSILFQTTTTNPVKHGAEDLTKLDPKPEKRCEVKEEDEEEDKPLFIAEESGDVELSPPSLRPNSQEVEKTPGRVEERLDSSQPSFLEPPALDKVFNQLFYI